MIRNIKQTIFHFKEEPIDDAPTHNLIYFKTKSLKEIKEVIEKIQTNGTNTIFTSRKNPIFDDRYNYMNRLQVDGDPFNLEELRVLPESK